MSISQLPYRAILCSAVAIVLSSICSAAPPQSKSPETSQAVVSLPDSPAGKQFSAWISVFNKGDHDALRSFVSTQFAPPPSGTLPVDSITDRQWGLYRAAKGFEVRKVAPSSPSKLAVFVQERQTGFWKLVRLTVSEQPPFGILGFAFRNIEAPEELLPSTRLSEREIASRVDELFTKFADSDTFSGVVLVSSHGQPIYQKAFWFASRAWKAQNQIDTKFNIASVGKMFTAVAVEQLAEKGKLSLDAKVGDVLPDYPNRTVATQVTIQQLLTHTSGLPGAIDKLRETLRRGDFRHVNDYLKTFENDALDSEPGTKFEYSNNGYALLGAIIEKASGQDYYEYLRQHVFGPAGMTGTDSYEFDSDPSGIATGYMDSGGGLRRSNIFELPVKGQAFGLGYSTAFDLMKFGEALENGKLLNRQSLDTVWTGRVSYSEPNSQYGDGFIVKRYNGTRIIGQAGGWPGVNAQVDYYPDLGYTVVILANYDFDTASSINKLREWLSQGR